MDIGVTVDFEKSSPKGDYVRGFAYLMTDAQGMPVTDYSGQFIDDPEVLRSAAHDFMANRINKAMHGKGALGRDGAQTGEVVESLVIDDDVAKALNINDARRGWFVGIKVNDPEIQKRIRNRELVQLSISGKGATQKVAA